MDSTFNALSLPQLQQIQNFYLNEMDKLNQERAYLIERGIDDGERLLRSATDPDVLDDIIIRLADLYYYQEKDDFLKRMEEYDRQIQDIGESGNAPVQEEPKLNYQKSLEMYQRIIDEFPQSDLMDDAIYNRGFLLEEMGQYRLATQTYQHLIHAFPDSRYVPEAYMRLGEYYFNPPNNDLVQAISFFKKVEQYKESQRYEEALYKLGWSYYRLSEYPEAISYFTTLIENVISMRSIVNQTKAARLDLKDEAIEYVAISFIDYGGPQKAFLYLKSLNWPEWSLDVLQKLGKIYMLEKEDYPLAIETFRLLLSVLGKDTTAPLVQQQIVDCYMILGQEDEAVRARRKLFENYGPNSVWFQTVEDEKSLLHAYRLAEQALRENFNATMRRAMQSNDPSLFEQSVELGHHYLEQFPEDHYAYMVRWNVALILDTKLHDYKAALQEYMTISLAYNSSEYMEFAREKGMASIKDAAQNAIVMADTMMRREKTIESAENPAIAKYTLEEDSLETLHAIPLMESEKWQLLTYDNYIKLFPFDSKTPTILSNAGVLYFTANQFDEALKYFKTLKNNFPESRQ
ncbi:tetratricopeptide repeat protein, partial [bacterium]|nr:tetratricopeptide repeat protein [candidate division CSSED10-310 bacterium]